MSEVQRYQVLPGSQYSGTMDQIPSCDGEYVLYSDYAALESQHAALKEKAEKADKKVKELLPFATIRDLLLQYRELLNLDTDALSNDDLSQRAHQMGYCLDKVLETLPPLAAYQASEEKP
jgi:hypothetical protein